MYKSWHDQTNHFLVFGKFHMLEKYLVKQLPEASFT